MKKFTINRNWTFKMVTDAYGLENFKLIKNVRGNSEPEYITVEKTTVIENVDMIIFADTVPDTVVRATKKIIEEELGIKIKHTVDWYELSERLSKAYNRLGNIVTLESNNKPVFYQKQLAISDKRILSIDYIAKACEVMDEIAYDQYLDYYNHVAPDKIKITV